MGPWRGGRRPRRREPGLDADPAPLHGRRRPRLSRGTDLDTPSSGARGAVVFLTGLSGAGKSTIAAGLVERLGAAHPDRAVTVLDGDELRRRGSADLGFDPASRAIQVERAANVAAELAANGAIVLVALIAPFTAARARARELIEPVAPFLLVWVRVPLAVAEGRDVKGLYAKARRGEIHDFTGVSSPYEEPADADLVVDTDTMTVAAAVDAVAARIESILG